ncbi:tyrosine-type recombinase/integrase [Nocardia sp. CA-128927]|uniref:tyrosine-type recombinase/integrase n=1 Tax=Nocardia sp. CA-128927 TaxID=3239975 RepID=UPI003D99B924
MAKPMTKKAKKAKTRRAANGAPSCRWVKAKGLYVARQANPNPDGKPLYTYSVDYDAALEKLRLKYDRALKGLDTSVHSESVHAWLEHWVEIIAKRTVVPKTYNSYRGIVDTHIVPLIGTKKLRKLKVEDLDEMYDQIVVRVRAENNGRYDGFATARLAQRVMRAALNAAMAREEVDRNVAKLSTPPGKSKKVRRAMTADQAKALLRTAFEANHPHTVAIAVMLFTGTRLGEVIGLTWDRVELSTRPDGTGGWVDVSWQLQSHKKLHGCGKPNADNNYPCGRKRGAFCPHGFFDFRPDYENVHVLNSLFLTRPKAGSLRQIPMTPQLNAFMMFQAQKTKDRPDNPNNFVFLDPRKLLGAEPIPPRYAWDMFKSCILSAGLPEDLVNHETRHTTATLLKEAGVDVDTIRMIIGHTETETTLIYIHINQVAAQQALDQLDAFLGFTDLPAVAAGHLALSA